LSIRSVFNEPALGEEAGEVVTMAAVPARPRPDREQGVFETLLVLDGQPIRLDAHLARLEASLEALFPDLPPPPELVRAIDEHARNVSLGGLRITVAPTAEGEIEATIEASKVEPERILPSRPRGIDAHSLVLPGGLGSHKWADRTLLDEEQERLGADGVPVIFDWDGTLLEASRANVFAVIDDALITPPADGRILPGIARACVLEIAADAGLETREAELCREDLTVADEVFLTGSLRGIEQVRTLDGAKLKTDGEVTARVAGDLRRAWIHGGLDRVPRR
jgi:para-aminobenzoate synthetase / 4-amino-4-deoxychorismate lyase